MYCDNMLDLKPIMEFAVRKQLRKTVKKPSLLCFSKSRETIPANLSG